MTVKLISGRAHAMIQYVGARKKMYLRRMYALVVLFAAQGSVDIQLLCGI